MKSIILSSILALSLFFTGCTEKGSPGNTSTPAATSPTPEVSASANVDLGEPFTFNEDEEKLLKEAYDGNLEAIKSAIEAKPSLVLGKAERHGYTLLHEASNGGRLEVATLLIDKGAVVDAQSEHRETPLHRTCHEGVNDAPKVAELLLKNGADLTIHMGSGLTPFQYCARSDDNIEDGRGIEVMKVLLEGGADLTSQNYSGLTPLHLAAEAGKLATVKFLIEQGTPVDIKSSGGSTALVTAKAYNRDDVAEYLRQKGAKE